MFAFSRGRHCMPAFQCLNGSVSSARLPRRHLSSTTCRAAEEETPKKTMKQHGNVLPKSQTGTTGEKKKEYNKMYYQQNKEAICEYMRSYYQERREARCDYMRSYYQEKRKARCDYMKSYYHANKEVINRNRARKASEKCNKTGADKA